MANLSHESQAQKWVFQVRNKHGASSGEPPAIDGNAPSRYYGYFENEHGEQAVFVYDYQTKTGIIWMGDAGWDKPHRVIDGLVPDLILSHEEETWLQACWNVATAFEGK